MYNKRRLIAITSIIVVIAVVGWIVFSIISAKKGENSPIKSFVPMGHTVVPSTQPKTSASGSGSSNPSSVNNPLSLGSTQSAPTITQLASTVQASVSFLTDSNGNSNFGIVSTKEPIPGWFIVKIRISGAGEINTVVLQQTGNPNNPLTVVAGPGTSFPPEYVSLPDAVRKAL